jgi:protein TonB
MAAAATPPAPPALRRAQSETSVAAARMASAPSFKAGKSKGGVPLVPILVGLVMIVAVAAFALLRGQPMAQTTAAVTPLDPSVTRIGRPPESSPLPQAEPDPAPPVVTRDLPGDPAAPPRERRKQPEREAAAAAPPAARAVRPPPAPAPAPAREVAKVEKPAPATPRPPPPTRPEPEPLPPPQFVASRQEMPSASAPLQIGPTYAREGQQKARLADPGCVKNSLRLPRDLVDIEGETATVKFAVDETGQVSQYAYLAGPSDPKVSNAIWAAIQRCPFIPGATSQGKPVALWVTMPIKFGR